MFGRKCSLCGSKLDRNQICTECGLDNKKTDANYKLNQSSCDNMPLTHVHDEKKYRESNKKNQHDKQKNMRKYQQRDQQRNTQREYGKYMEQFGKKEDLKKKKKKPGYIAIIIIVVLIFQVCGVIFPLIVDEIDSIYEDYNDSYEEYDPYEYLGEELPEEGEHASYELTSGNYIVGIHIPAGNYIAQTEYEYDAVQITDPYNSIYLYEYEGKETGYLDDLRLFDGALITIESDTSVTFLSENAQISDMRESVKNPVTESYVVEGEKTIEIGTDIQAGVYDVQADSDDVYLKINIMDENGETWYSRDLSLGASTYEGEKFKNLVLPENATISCEEGQKFYLTPSGVIESTDYLEYYYTYY